MRAIERAEFMTGWILTLQFYLVKERRHCYFPIPFAYEFYMSINIYSLLIDMSNG